MPTACDNSCDICMHDFNGADRKSVALPCGHDFCLTCLVRLKTGGSHKCPKCRGDWAELEVDALTGMEDEKGAGQQGEEDEEDENGKKDGDLCLDHQFSFQYWCVDDSEFHCKKCIVQKRCLQLELIDEAIPLIKTDLRRRVTETLEQNQTDLGELEQLKKEISGKLNLTKQYKEAVQKVEDNLQDYVTRIEVRIVEKRKSSTVVEDIRGRIKEVRSQLDVPLVVKSRTTLEALSKPTAVPNTDTSRALLCNIACTYMEVTGLEGPPSKAAFICGLQTASGSSVGPLTEVVRGAEKLKEGGEWFVDRSNCMAALFALADRQPSVLALEYIPNESKALPVTLMAAVAKAARGCDVEVSFYGSFLAPQDPKKDAKRLYHILQNSSIRVTRFWGHLDAAGIATLPPTIQRLGLSIGSAADARAVSDLRPWEELMQLAVAVSSGVAAQDLRPLPSVSSTCLHFPHLTDTLVDNVRPAINALMEGRRLRYLLIDFNEVTADGAHRLARLLRGAEICKFGFQKSFQQERGRERWRLVLAKFERLIGSGVTVVYN